MASAPKAENSFFSKERANSGYYGHHSMIVSILYSQRIHRSQWFCWARPLAKYAFEPGHRGKEWWLWLWHCGRNALALKLPSGVVQDAIAEGASWMEASAYRSLAVLLAAVWILTPLCRKLDFCRWTKRLCLRVSEAKCNYALCPLMPYYRHLLKDSSYMLWRFSYNRKWI
jgi:hypothetical protein